MERPVPGLPRDSSSIFYAQQVNGPLAFVVGSVLIVRSTEVPTEARVDRRRTVSVGLSPIASRSGISVPCRYWFRGVPLLRWSFLSSPRRALRTFVPSRPGLRDHLLRTPWLFSSARNHLDVDGEEAECGTITPILIMRNPDAIDYPLRESGTLSASTLCTTSSSEQPIVPKASVRPDRLYAASLSNAVHVPSESSISPVGGDLRRNRQGPAHVQKGRRPTHNRAKSLSASSAGSPAAVPVQNNAKETLGAQGRDPQRKGRRRREVGVPREHAAGGASASASADSSKPRLLDSYNRLIDSTSTLLSSIPGSEASSSAQPPFNRAAQSSAETEKRVHTNSPRHTDRHPAPAGRRQPSGPASNEKSRVHRNVGPPKAGSRPLVAAAVSESDEPQQSINQQISAAADAGDWQQILHICDESYDDLDAVSVATAMHRLGRLTRRRKCTVRELHAHNGLDALVRRFHEIGDTLQGSLPIFAHGAASARLEDRSTFNRIAELATDLVPEFTTQNLSNLAWSFGTVGMHHSSLLAEIASAASRNASSMKPQGLANIAWAFATLRDCNLELFSDIAKASSLILHEFAPQELASLVWAYATLRINDKQLLVQIAEVTLEKLDGFNVQTLTMLTWSFASLQYGDRRLFARISRQAGRKITDFQPQNFSTIAYAFAVLGITDHELFVRLCAAALPRLHTFNPQQLSNFAWALATLHVDDQPALLNRLGDAAVPQLGRFKPQELANLAWSFATLQTPHPQLFAEIARVSRTKLSDFTSQGLSNLAWAFAKLNESNTPLFKALAKTCTERTKEFTPQGLANVAWAFATLDVRDQDLFGRIASAARKKLKYFNPQGLVNLAWAFAELDLPNEVLIAEIMRAAVLRLNEFGHVDLAHLAWTCAAFDIRNYTLLAQISTAALDRIDEFSPKSLCMLAWATGTLGYNGASRAEALALYGSIICMAQRRIDDLTPKDLSRMLLGLASVRVRNATFLLAAADRFCAVVDAASIAQIANMAWAFAVLDRPDLAARVLAESDARGKFAASAPELDIGSWTQFRAVELFLTSLHTATHSRPTLPQPLHRLNAQPLELRRGPGTLSQLTDHQPRKSPRSAVDLLHSEPQQSMDLLHSEPLDLHFSPLLSEANFHQSSRSQAPSVHRSHAEPLPLSPPAKPGQSHKLPHRASRTPPHHHVQDDRVSPNRPLTPSRQTDLTPVQYSHVASIVDASASFSDNAGETQLVNASSSNSGIDATTDASPLFLGSTDLLRIAHGPGTDVCETEHTGPTSKNASTSETPAPPHLHLEHSSLLAPTSPTEDTTHDAVLSSDHECRPESPSIRNPRSATFKPSVQPDGTIHAFPPALTAKMEVLAGSEYALLISQSTCSSSFQRSVVPVLTAVRPGFDQEFCVAGAYVLDVAYADEKVALEVDGQTHFLSSGHWNGPTEFKDRVLRGLGWRMYHVSYDTWNEMRSSRERREFLQDLIQ